MANTSRKMMSDGGEKTALSRLNKQVPVHRVNNVMPLYMYQRSAWLLLRQAGEYRKRGDLGSLYVMDMRFLSLVLQTIPEHRDFDGGERGYRELKGMAKGVLKETKESGGVEGRYRSESKGVVKMRAGHVPGLHWDGGVQEEGNGDGTVSAPGKDTDMVLSQYDVESLDVLGTAGWQAGNAINNSSNRSHGDDNTLKNRKENSALLESMKGIVQGLKVVDGSVGSKHSIVMNVQNNMIDRESKSKGGDSMAPSLYPDPRMMVQLGPQEVKVTSVPMSAERMLMDDGAGCSMPPLPPPPKQEQQQQLPSSSYVMSDRAYESPSTQNQQQIRDVHVSSALMDEFLRYAAANTRQSIETCGILAGSLSPETGQFVISTLIIPKQEGTTDTVQALAEEEIFEAQDSRSLYPLGWIHTHPSQSCFLSSIDVHTQCGYQTMLDEAIAIVMAPTDMTSPVGIFRLTTPGGLKLIQQCTLRGFHTHPPTETGQKVYDLCNHVYLNPRVGFEVLDLRSQ
jgi:STAM-binding protein